MQACDLGTVLIASYRAVKCAGQNVGKCFLSQ